MPMEVMLKSKTVRETLKAKGYDLNEVETGSVKIEEDLRRLFEKLADDKPVVRRKNKDEPEVTTLRKRQAARGEDSLKEKQPDDKEMVQRLVEKIAEEILRRTTFRKCHQGRKPNTLDLVKTRGVADIRRRR